ncbi:arsenate reductase (glutaredoxin) [Gimesia aquarii]|uniref:Arsenate reductase n=1 Tax=Gimesia aquarii TaxID=2527964 RepID=A0A517W1N6_9PLAN|nr:arsenate reductase (glutaredoxin) [Gimesia aquarii]QDT99157.1 Arsenate reductase [Gimesia aquarii]
MIKIYHNPRCSKSRQALALIEESGNQLQVIEYLKSPPTAEELDSILKKLNREPQELMRKGEKIYRELNLAEQEMSREEAIAVMVEHPTLIERPIVVKGRKAVLGRPPENVNELL